MKGDNAKKFAVTRLDVIVDFLDTSFELMPGTARLMGSELERDLQWFDRYGGLRSTPEDSLKKKK